MTPARFLKTRISAWDRLEALIKKASPRGARALTDSELRELTLLYPAVAVDVARARMYKIDPNTQNRINQLAISAHGLLYRRKSVKSIQVILTFFRDTYPRLFRRLWPYTVLATAVFTIGFIGAYISTVLTPSNAYIFVPGQLDLTENESGISSEDISERFRRIPKPPMGAFIMANNISVAFRAFALGITAGIGTCFIILFNAMMLGGFAAHFSNHNLAYEFWSFIIPHGILEIFAILISAAAGLKLGLSFAIPGRLKRSASLRIGAHDSVLLVIGTVPMFVVAGLIESVITPSYIPGFVKIALGLTFASFTIGYLILAGRRPVGRGQTKLNVPEN